MADPSRLPIAPPPVVFRNAGPRDAAVLAALGAKSFIDTFGHLYAPADLEAFLDNHREDKWARELADPANAIRIGEADGAAVVYAKITTPPVMPYDPEPGRTAYELKQFYVLGPWQGSGIADELMRWLLDTARARRADDLYLSVFTQNNRARRFYERYGFGVIGQWSFMVGQHADEDYIMRLRLRAASTHSGTP